MFLTINYDIQSCLLLCIFLFNVRATRSQRETIVTRRTDFLTDKITRLYTQIKIAKINPKYVKKTTNNRKG